VAQVVVRYFAAVRERVGLERETFELDADSTLADLWAILVQHHPALDGLRGHLRFSVNLEFGDDTTVLADGDEVGIIPPVAGGVQRPPLLSEVSLSVGVVRAAVARPEAGAIVVFEGVVRNHSLGRDVDYLEYEVYPEMATSKLQQVIDEVEAQHPTTRCALVHRHGRLVIGDLAVVIAVSAPHREPAFRACAFAIDRIKEIVPIWKREVGPDGTEWVGMGS